MNVEKISQYFFIVAAVVAILDGALSLSESMKAVKFVVLILSGIIVGALKSSQEKEFLISGVAVVVTGYILVELLGSYFFVEGLGLMLLNFIIFLSSALVVVGIQQVGSSLTTIDEHISHTSLSNKQEKKKNPMHMNHKEIELLAMEKVWGIVILVAVAFTFIILIGEMFFDVGAYEQTFLIIEIIITILFLVDLVVLYEKSKNFKEFLRTNMFDIVAAIPTLGALRALKIIRAVRVVKTLGKGLKMSKVLKMYKTSKFFSEKSYFNHVENAGKKTKSNAFSSSKKEIHKK